MGGLKGKVHKKPKEEEAVNTIKTVEFKVGGTLVKLPGAKFSSEKTYIAKFDKPPKIGDVKEPKAKSDIPKDIYAAYADMVKKYEPKIYEVGPGGKETLVKDPSEKMLAFAGDALVRKSKVYSAVLKKA